MSKSKNNKATQAQKKSPKPIEGTIVDESDQKEVNSDSDPYTLTARLKAEKTSYYEPPQKGSKSYKALDPKKHHDVSHQLEVGRGKVNTISRRELTFCYSLTIQLKKDTLTHSPTWAPTTLTVR
jgi:hypothetical protein